MESVTKLVSGWGLAVSFVLASGCINSRLAWDASEEVDSPAIGGVYKVVSSSKAGLESRVFDSMKKLSQSKTVEFVSDSADNALPVALAVSRGASRETVGAIGSVNNILSVCTLGVWPYVKSSDQPYSVSLVVPFPRENGAIEPAPIAQREIVIGERNWASFLIPFAAIPCPGWGDWRKGCSTDSGDAAYVEYCNKVLAKDALELMTKDVYQSGLRKFSEKNSAMLKRRQAAIDAVKSSVEAKQRSAVTSDVDLRPIALIDEKYFNVAFGKESVSGKRSVKDTVMENMGDALGTLGVFRVLSKRTIANNLKERDLFTKLTGEDSASAVGNLGMPGYVVEASVLQYETKINTTTKKDYHKHKKESNRRIYEEKTAHVKIAIKIADLESQDIVFSKVYEKSDNSGTKKIGTASVSYGNENGKSFDSDAAMLIPLVRQIAEAAAADMIKSQVFHVIACTSEGELTVDLASSLIKEGDKLDIFSRGKNVVSARSGMNKREEVKMGSLRVVEAQPSYCKARFEIIEKIPNNLDVIVRVAK